MQSVEELAKTITALPRNEQEALLDKVAQLNFQKGLADLSERYRARLARERELRGIDAVRLGTADVLDLGVKRSQTIEIAEVERLHVALDEADFLAVFRFDAYPFALLRADHIDHEFDRLHEPERRPE